MADYNISAEITADASGFESGVKKAQKASKNLSKSISGVIQGLGKSGLVGALGAVGLATGGVVTVLNTVTKVAKKVAQTIDECSESYRKQYQAEIALSTAVNNNPYVDGTATKRLKEFASEMQRVSDVGDEELLPMMADLIAKGRTEEETMQIMSVALDMSAGGAMSLETALTQLNATLNGNVGRLGQQNAELKNLTEEELKQGKAVEILGEKYKGLAQATADSQKQLRNAIGDLKENIGQIFEQALAPMRKFFTEVITNLNNSITKSRELKSAMKEVFGDNGEVNLEASTDALNTAFTEILHKQQEVTRNYQQYIRLYGEYIDQTTDETALSYKAQISELNAQIKAISEELNKRRKESEEEKKRLAQAKADEEAQKEIKRQKEIREKELALENEWADKLLAIRIENLEKQRDRELENEKLTQEQKEEIFDFYSEQILAMKIRQLEKERDEILSQENLTDESRQSINLYYENKITNARKDEEDKRLKLKKKTSKEEVKDEKIKFSQMIKVAQEYTKKMGETLKNVAKKIASTVKSVLSTVGNVFTSIFEFNPDEALDNLLKFEDSVLTFFVETLPKLPAFFSSAVDSIVRTIQAVLNIIDFNSISTIIDSIIKSVGSLISSTVQFISNNADRITKGISDLISTIVQSIANWVASGGWRDVLNALLTIQKALEKIVTDNINEIVDTIIDMLPDLINMLIDSIVSASRTLAKLIKPILKLIVKLIEAIIEVAFSDEVIDASMEVIEGFVEAVVEVIIQVLPKVLPKLISKLTRVAIRSLVSFPIEIAKSIIQGLVKAFSNTNWGEVIRDIFMGFIDAFKELFGIHSPSTLFEGFGTNIIEGLWNGIKNMGSWLWDNVGGFFSSLWEGIQNIFSNVGNWFKNVFENAVSNIKNAFSGIGDWFSNLFNNIKKGLSDAVNTVKDGFEKIYDWATGDDGTITGSNAGDVGLAIATGGLSEVGKGIKRLFGWANGSNNVPRGLAIVGEQGPELVRFNGGEQVLNTRNTQKALAGAGGTTINQNVTFNNLQDTTAFAMMQQLKQYNRQMAINGVI